MFLCICKNLLKKQKANMWSLNEWSLGKSIDTLSLFYFLFLFLFFFRFRFRFLCLWLSLDMYIYMKVIEMKYSKPHPLLNIFCVTLCHFS